MREVSTPSTHGGRKEPWSSPPPQTAHPMVRVGSPSRSYSALGIPLPALTLIPWSCDGEFVGLSS